MVHTRILECMHTRHAKGNLYIRDGEVLRRALYEFGFIHYNNMHDVPPHGSMTDIKREIYKSKSLQRRLRTTFLFHTPNLRKYAKNVYFDVLLYGIAKYTNHWEDLSKNNRRHQNNNGGSEDDRLPDGDGLPPRVPSSYKSSSFRPFHALYEPMVRG